jgi:acyl carrier protein
MGCIAIMSDVHTRLVGCFQVVFPGASTKEITGASSGSLPAWDSIAQAILLAVVEEEFGISIPPERVVSLVSFAALERYILSPEAPTV